MGKLWFVEQIDRCVGCYACRLACRQENEFSKKDNTLNVVQAGPEHVDEKLTMDFIVFVEGECLTCHNKIKNRLRPPCVSVCATNALHLVDTRELLHMFRKGKRIQILKIYDFARAQNSIP